MSFSYRAASISVAVFVLFSPCLVNAGCVDYIPKTVFCGAGCEPVDTTGCFFGCISGTCVSRGGSGECCGHIYYSAVIYQDSGNCGNECGGTPLRIPERHVSVSSRNNVNMAWSPGFIQIGEGVRVREYRRSLVPNHCAHSYMALVETPIQPAGR
jgi:hypothetical protein